MRLYFAGADAELKLFERLKVNQLLIAYPFAKKLEKYNSDWLIDSGAFTAFNTGKIISLKEYCDWIIKNKVKLYVGLDDIKDPDKTMANMKIMRKMGLNPIPTYHYGEDISYLKAYCEEYDYIAIGGLVPIKNKKNSMINFLNKCFKEAKGKKLHALGVNNYELMLRYPFYSVDATSWHNPVRWGQNFHFEKGKLLRTNHMKKTLDKVKSKEEKLIQAVKAFQEAEAYITALWERRGIKWDN